MSNLKIFLTEYSHSFNSDEYSQIEEITLEDIDSIDMPRDYENKKGVYEGAYMPGTKYFDGTQEFSQNIYIVAESHEEAMQMIDPTKDI